MWPCRTSSGQKLWESIGALPHSHPCSYRSEWVIHGRCLHTSQCRSISFTFVVHSWASMHTSINSILSTLHVREGFFCWLYNYACIRDHPSWSSSCFNQSQQVSGPNWLCHVNSRLAILIELMNFTCSMRSSTAHMHTHTHKDPRS